MKRLILLICSNVLFLMGYAQNPAIDTMKSKLSRATTSYEKVDLMGKLCRSLMAVNPPEADKYAEQMTMEAELSRDRRLMVKALLANGERFSYLSFQKVSMDKSISYYNQALELAKKNDLDKETVKAYIGLASITAKIPDLDKALNLANQASSITTTLKDDTLSVSVYNIIGNIYLLKKERILSLRNYLSALRIAEEAKNHSLMRSCYSFLSKFYADIKEYDKAIDYAQKALDELALTGQENEKVQKVIDLFGLGGLHMAKKNYTMSAYYYEVSIKLADSLNFQQLKLPAYEGLLNQYIQSDQPRKALQFLNDRKEFSQYAARMGTEYMIDGSYAIIYNQTGQMDSAQYYFSKAEPVYEAKGTPPWKMGFYFQYARFFKSSGNYDKAIEYFDKARAIANATSSLESQQMIAKELDTVYSKKGDFQQAHLYNGLYYEYKDSLLKLGEEKDVLQMELADEQQRQARMEREKEAALNAKHNIQYMGITITIAVVFLLLVLLGIFQVSESTIKVMGFFAFILLFEFIILIADNKIHHWTHGEPLPILGIKIVLIAMLLPFHHWLEHKVVSYLASKRMILPRSKGFLGTILPKPKSTVEP